MFKASLIATFLILCLGVVTGYSAEEERVEECRVAVKQLAGKLKGELLAALKEGGPLNAIAVCSLEAPAIAESISRDKGWQIRRTSLKFRNPENAPGSWERRALESFVQRRSGGEDPKAMEHYEAVTGEGMPLFRYMKPIPVGQPCLTCHGKKVSPEIKAKLEEVYPDDRATGYSAGEIIGAFSISQPL